MPRTRTTFKPGHKGTGGRPKGRNISWRKHDNQALAVGQNADQITTQLLDPSTLAIMSMGAAVRLFEAIRKRYAAHQARARLGRPIVTLKTFTSEFGLRQADGTRVYMDPDLGPIDIDGKPITAPTVPQVSEAETPTLTARRRTSPSSSPRRQRKRRSKR
jgi:hypothetical protein